jgi:hypothetical protein
MLSRFVPFVVCLFFAVFSSCQRSGDQRTVNQASLDLPEGHVPVGAATPLPPVAQRMIDSANARFSAKQYAEALALYRETLALAPGHPAPWFGISMAAGALGDRALADSAQRALRQRGMEGSTHPTTPLPNAAPLNPHAPGTTPRPSGS